MNRSSYVNTIAVATLLLCGAGCAKKKVAITPPPAPPATQATQQPATPTEVARATPPAPAPQPAPQVASKYPDAATRARIDELLGRIQDAYFDYNRHTLRDDAV